MFGFVLGVTARMYYTFRRFMPTNIVLDAIHTRRGLRWGVPAMLLAVPYTLAAAFCVGFTNAGGSGWLSILALLLLWNALKFLVAGPLTLFQLLVVRASEARERPRATASSKHDQTETAGTESRNVSRSGVE